MKRYRNLDRFAAAVLVVLLVAAAGKLGAEAVAGAGISVLVGEDESRGSAAGVRESTEERASGEGGSAAGTSGEGVSGGSTPGDGRSGSMAEAESMVEPKADSGMSEVEPVAEVPGEEAGGMMGGVHVIEEIAEIGATPRGAETSDAASEPPGAEQPETVSEPGAVLEPEESMVSESETVSEPGAVSEPEESTIPEPESEPGAISEPEESTIPEPESEPGAVSEPEESTISESESEPSAISEPEEPASIPESVGGAQEIRLGFAGDINFDEDWATTKYMDEQGGILSVFSENLVELMRGFDIFMLNNEFTYSTRGEKTEKSYNFRSDPARVENLHTLGVDIVLLANNHVFDYGEDALLDTFETLEAAGIPYVGAGRNLEEAMRPYYFTVNGRRIAYVAASSAEEYTPSIATRAATEEESGILACYDPTLFLQAIAEAKANSDFVVANVHWGMEYDDQYYDNQRELAERMVAAGADAIIGTHTHCLQGINFIEGVPVFYSLGNYWFNDRDLYTGVAELTLRVPDDPAKAVELINTKFYPCTQYGLFTNMPTDEAERQEILSYLQGISHDLVSIDADGNVRDNDGNASGAEAADGDDASSGNGADGAGSVEPVSEAEGAANAA